MPGNNLIIRNKVTLVQCIENGKKFLFLWYFLYNSKEKHRKTCQNPSDIRKRLSKYSLTTLAMIH